MTHVTSRCHTKRRMGMTTTKTLRSVCSWRTSIMSSAAFILNATILTILNLVTYCMLLDILKGYLIILNVGHKLIGLPTACSSNK